MNSGRYLNGKRFESYKLHPIVKSHKFAKYLIRLGQFLLNNKSKMFNVAGKLSLNEWKGEKNVEFIIDDISVIKNQKN